MIRSYLKIALRNLSRHKGYAFINVSGLGVGMACCMFILLFVRDELSYDRHHRHSDRIYRIVSDWGAFSVPATNPPTVKRLESDYPEMTVARLMPISGVVRHEDRSFREERIYFSNPAVFDVFTLPLLTGDSTTALAAPHRVVLSETTAQKYFGSEDPIGKALLIDNQIEVEVTGVAVDLPPQSHFHPDFWVSWGTLDALFDYSNSMNWGNNSIYTYLLLPQEYDAAGLEAQFPDFISRHAGENWNGATLSLQPLTGIHLRSHHDMELEPNSNFAYVYVFSLVAIFILLVACINFINLTTARSAERAREVGVRKAAGAFRRQLVLQFLAESLLLAGVALVLAVALAVIAMPAFRALSGKALALDVLTGSYALAGFLGIAVLVGVAAGSYPAFVLSAFRPAAVLKGTVEHIGVGGRLRKGLVVFQFATSVILIVGTLVISSQVSHLRGATLGFDKEQVLTIPWQANPTQVSDRVAAYPVLKEAFLQDPGVLGVSIASESLPSELLNGAAMTIEGAGFGTDGADGSDGWGVRVVSVGHDFFETLGVGMVAGRSFSLNHRTDSSAFIMNETAFRMVSAAVGGEVQSPDNLIGKQVRLSYGERTGPIIGITKDFHMSSLHEEIEPILFFVWPLWYNNVLVRVQTAEIPATVAALRHVWEQVIPEWPFEYGFADDAFGARYRAEERLGRVFAVFAGLALLIASLGLFGLAAFTAERRTKEIGVRKVLGAKVSDVVMMLTRDFALLVVGGFLLAAPVAYVAMNRWLDDFAYRIDLSPGTFILAGLFALVVAVTTVSSQAVKAAVADPVKSLRYE